MKRGRPRTKSTAPTDLASALATLPADALRQVIHDLLLELDDRTHARVVASLIDRATREGSGWTPGAVSDAAVAEVLAFAKAARRAGHADPSDVDEHLRRGTAAFLRKDYAAARQIFAALLLPLGDGSIDLGQDELLDEVLGADVGGCAAQYVVSAYMLAAAADRAEAVRAAIDEVQSIEHFWEPLREMEQAAVEPLSDLAAFLPRWRSLIERRLANTPAGKRADDWDTEDHRWLREVVQRLEGPHGLAKVARSTRRADDLHAWCRSLVDANDWHAARKAFVEAAELVTGDDDARGDFLDGAALAAQQLGRSDVRAHLERAWRASPSTSRLRRWLGASRTKAALGEQLDAALAACPKNAARQRALLHVLSHDVLRAAKLLAAAPGLGWSDPEHPLRRARVILEASLHRGREVRDLLAHHCIASRYGRIPRSTRRIRAYLSSTSSFLLFPRPRQSRSASSTTSMPIWFRNRKQSTRVFSGS